MNCVRNSYSGHMLYIRTFIWLCSSWGLLHWHYWDDTTAQILPLSWIVELPLGTGKALLFLGRDALCQKSPRYPGWAVAGLPSTTHLPPRRLSRGCIEFPRQMGGSRGTCSPMAEAQTEAPPRWGEDSKGNGGRLRDEVNVYLQESVDYISPSCFYSILLCNGYQNQKMKRK